MSAVDPAAMWAYAARPIGEQCTATLRAIQRTDRTLRRCALPAGHYRVDAGRGPDEHDQSWHTDDPDRAREDGVTWADSARGAVPHNAPDHLRHAIENDTEDAPLLAVLAAADRAAPRVRRVPGAAMVAGRFEVPPRLPDEISEGEAWALHGYHRRLAAELEDAKQRTRRDVAAVIT